MKPRSRWSRSLAPVLMLAALPVPTALAAQQVEQFRLQGNQVAIFNLAGETRVEAGSGREVTVEVTRSGADARRLQIQTGRLGGHETLRVVTPGDRVVYPRLNRGSRSQLQVRSDGAFGKGWNGGRRVTVAGSGDGLEAYADLRIRVPAGQRIAVHQGTGQVWVANVDGQLLVDGASTAVDVQSVRGSLTVDVGSGRVRVQGVEGDVDVDTGSGSVELNGIRGQRLRVDTGSGGVSGDGIEVHEMNVDVGSGRVRLTGVRMNEGVIDTGSGSVDLALVAPVRSLRIDTGSGGVTLTAPRALNAELVIDTGSGGIRVDLPAEITESRRSFFRGRIGSGEGRVRIDTGSGGVRVREG
jgi:lia operon protein LiaG